ncbi:MAG: DUF1573 domain-containing protein [candidate division Zixibacteria bacterium]
MYKIATLTGLIFLIIAAVSVSAEPDMKINGETFDYGYVPQRAKVVHAFWLKSVGDTTLYIKTVKPACGCTKAPLEKNLIEPGDSSKLEITFSTRKYTGSVKKSIKITTNASDSAQNIYVAANVFTDPSELAPLTVEPYTVEITAETVDANDAVLFSITNNSNADVRLKPIEWAKHLFDIDIPEVIKAGETKQGKVILFAESYMKSFSKSITIELDDENKIRYSLPVLKQTFFKKKTQ